ncbi:hypothetical protein L249_0914 [Ophiocordyceps polyrhachis-furcata BCC 54312]|uniref:Calcineurin-like phosphoesterase domain-containing protein n=1 Tax=Ophiocordyceps polyrhachis-furcata BCC 54312 TaxID=1330021 RepID=A0A367LEN4_9HYPO|nr:hypothetical protein L249_0914 [Ophiocordyceps polyrhachis-furcata BCC 54312]
MALLLSLMGLASPALTSQPGAAPPVPAPMRDLPWGQLNFLHTTDTHGWLGGHPAEPQYAADWGDYVSFAHHLRRRADESGSDLVVVDTGDRVEGNGLYDASEPKGRYLLDVLASQHLDLACIGNHELYRRQTVEREHNLTVPRFGDAYVASNVDYIDPATGEASPLASRYRKFKTKNLGLNIVAFGFLFDFVGNANNSRVHTVADTISQPWFQKAMHEKPDLFLVAAHIGLRMPELRAIFTALRKQNWHIPVVFFGGHAHVRDAVRFDSLSIAMASGRYLETIGWMSIDGIRPKPPPAPLSSSSSPLSPPPPSTAIATSLTFNRKYIDSNLYGMYYHTGLNATSFPTDQGLRASEAVAAARKALDLDHRFGCAPHDLWTTRAPYPGNGSVYSWLENEVLPDVVVNSSRSDRPRLAFINTGGIRFDIFKGPFTRDSLLAVSPFKNHFLFVPDVPYAIARKLLAILNSGGVVGVGDRSKAPLVVAEFQDEINEDDVVRPELRRRGSSSQKPDPSLLPGYTTKDDLGSDGDDTVRSQVESHRPPNCIQSRIGFPSSSPLSSSASSSSSSSSSPLPEKVDVVFIDFLRPWLIAALKFAGGDYSDADVGPYLDVTFTCALEEWVVRHWLGDC